MTGQAKGAGVGYLDIVFDGPPAPESGRFIECEVAGRSVKVGEWIPGDDGYWRLRLPWKPNAHGEERELAAPPSPKPAILPPGQRRPGSREQRCIPCPCGRINLLTALFCGECGRSLELIRAMRLVPIAAPPFESFP